MKKNCGFTVLELLVTTSIIAIVFGLGVARYNQFNRRQIVVQAANELKSNLRLAQEKALSGEKDCRAAKCGGTDDVCGNEGGEKSLDGWYVSFITANSYQIYGQCGGDTTFPDSPKTIDVSGITFSSSVNPIHFYPLGLGVEEAAVITLSNVHGDTGTATVNKAGEIY